MDELLQETDKNLQTEYLICTLSKIPGFARWAKPGKAQSNKQESSKRQTIRNERIYVFQIKIASNKFIYQ